MANTTFDIIYCGYDYSVFLDGGVMMATLIRWDNDKIIYENDDMDISEVVEYCTKNKISMSYADLRGADLYGADLRGADLYGADLKGAYFKGADLKGAYFKGADFKGASLKGADLKGASLKGAYLKGAENIHSFQAGELNRTCYAVRHKNNVMFKIGCFWGDTKAAIIEIRKKYGVDSSYEKLVLIYTDMLMKDIKNDI